MSNNNIQKKVSILFINNSFRKIAILFFALFIIIKTQAQVGIGINPPDPSAMLHVESTTKGVLITRMTAAQRIAIVSPAEGLLVYQVGDTDPGFWYFSLGQWRNLSSLNNGGLHTIYLTDAITNAQAIAKIAAEYGPNTQEIRIVRCTNLTTVDLSMITKLTEVFLLGNIVLQSVNLDNLQTVDGGINIDQCPALTSMPLSHLQRVGQSAYNNMGLSVRNSGLANLNFPLLVALDGYIDIEYNNALSAISFPVFANHDFVNGPPILIVFNSVLTSISFASMHALTDLQIESNRNLTTVNLPVLATARNVTINGGINITSLSFPVLTTSGQFHISGDSLLTTFSAPLLTTTDELYISSTPVLTGLSAPALATANNLSLQYCSSLTSANFPALASVSGILTFQNNNLLTGISLPVLVTAGGLYMNNCPLVSSLSAPLLASTTFNLYGPSALTSISLPSLTTIGGGNGIGAFNNAITGNQNLTAITVNALSSITGSNLNLNGNKLPSAQVNYLLNKFVSITPALSGKTINLNQALAAPPTGQGIADKATLIAGGNSVFTD